MIENGIAFSQKMVDLYSYIYQLYLSRIHKIPLHSLDKCNFPQKDIINIVGGGASAIETLVAASDSEVFMTCNLSVALRKSWDIVLIEHDAAASFRRPLFKALDQATCDLVFLKNNYLHRPRKEFSYYKSHEGIKHLFILKESQSQTAFDGVRKVIVDLLEESAVGLIRQYSSSVFTMIMIGIILRPKVIKLHGIDFGGDSFYTKSGYEDFWPGDPKHISKKGRKVAGTDIKTELLQLKSLLAKHGIDLMGLNL